MKSYDVGTAHRRSGVFPYVELWEQPLYRWLLFRAYHWWEKLTEPAMRKISEYHRVVFGAKAGLDYIPLVNRRDIRCYHLSIAGRNTLAIAYITKEQYDVITGRAPKEVEPRHEVKEPILAPEGIESFTQE